MALLGLNQVGGRYDGSEGAKDNYVDFVGHVVQGGGVGTAQIVWERDPVGGDPGPAEDFAFIEGSVVPAPNTTGVSGDYFNMGGAAVAGGSYNEGLTRDYILTVTQAGSTDGPDPSKRAVVQVSTAQDGIIVNALTIDAKQAHNSLPVLLPEKMSLLISTQVLDHLKLQVNLVAKNMMAH